MFDVIILGTGIAGLTCALKLSQKQPHIRIACLSKNSLENCNTKLAQGGIACVNSPKDSYKYHIEDTLKASAYTSKKKIVEEVVKKANTCLVELEEWGVKFNKTSANQFELGLEGGHQYHRIVHVDDHTGKSVLKTLLKQVKSKNNIELRPYHYAYELILTKDKQLGIKLFDIKQKKHYKLFAQYVVIATGGMGHFFKQTTNSLGSTGDGLVLAKNAGAKIKNLQYIQFHPTTFYEKNKQKVFLISEAVRGAGAFVINKKGERFLFQSDPRGELATRDIVSKAIFKELEKSKEQCVFLDLRHLLNFEKEFPTINAFLQKKMLRWYKDLIPIIPAAHYQCGGIEVDENGNTSINHLYAIGECADTGLHGINRLASNSLLEALVFADNCAKNILSKNFIKGLSNDSNFLPDKSVNTQLLIRKLNLIHKQVIMLSSNIEKEKLVLELDKLLEEVVIKIEQNANSLNLICLKNKITLTRLMANRFS